MKLCYSTVVPINDGTLKVESYMYQYFSVVSLW